MFIVCKSLVAWLTVIMQFYYMPWNVTISFQTSGNFMYCGWYVLIVFLIILEKMLIARSSGQREFEVTSAAGMYPSTMRLVPGDNDTSSLQMKNGANISTTKSHTSTPEFSVHLKLFLSLINNQLGKRNLGST